MISNLITKYKKGFTLIEILVVLGILAIITTLIFNTFVDFRRKKALEADTKMVVEVLIEARNQTLTSQNSSQYGVHFSLSPVPQIVLFAGATYVANAVTNKVYPLASTDNILTVTLVGGGSNIVFNRLTGETNQSGTIILSSPSLSVTKSVTIYKTGSIESQ